MHDVFVGLPEALQRYEERGRFPFWLRRVTARGCLMLLRSRREAPIEAMGNGPIVVSPAGAEAGALETALTRLPPQLRAVVLLKAEGHSHAEIAELLGISEAASRVRLTRGLKRLRKLMEDDE